MLSGAITSSQITDKPLKQLLPVLYPNWDEMEKGMIQFKDAKSPEEMLATSAFFERIADAEKDKWLPYYYAAQTQILAASVRHPLHIIQCAKIGADVMTGPLSAILQLLKHPLTDSGLAQFLADHAKANAK